VSSEALNMLSSPQPPARCRVLSIIVQSMAVGDASSILLSSSTVKQLGSGKCL